MLTDSRRLFVDMPDGKRVTYEEPVGANTELLAVRVPVALMQALEAMAKKEPGGVPELTRRLLWYHLAPAAIRQSVKRLKRGETTELARIGTYQALIRDFMALSERLNSSISLTDSLRERVAAQQAKFGDIVEEWSQEVASLFGELERVEESLDTTLETEQEVAE